MPSDDIAISVRHLTKTYRIFGHPGDRVKQAATFGLKRYHKEFTALRDVSFDIRKGETVGIIGRNGSGKSTLLQLICGILKPTSGTVRVDGRVSALLELGAGFNAEFTGRENVYFQAALMGLKKDEVDRRFDEIAAFADIGEFIDQPVRTYSSGMFVRLAFSVAVHVDPDILIVDETLSVGDMAFQHRSKKRAHDLIEGGTSLLLVSHDKSMIVSTCRRCILLDAGQKIADADPAAVFDYYYASLAAKAGERIERRSLGSRGTRITSGTGEARVESISLRDDAVGSELETLEVGMPVRLEFIVRTYQQIPRLALAFVIRDKLGQTMFATNTKNFGQRLVNLDAGSAFRFTFQFHADMGPGSYSISTFLLSDDDRSTANFETRELAHFFELINTTHPLFAGSVWLDPKLDVRPA
jgi:lipopolysaccharide transport system ATP-binding protein